MQTMIRTLFILALCLLGRQINAETRVPPNNSYEEIQIYGTEPSNDYFQLRLDTSRNVFVDKAGPNGAREKFKIQLKDDLYDEIVSEISNSIRNFDKDQITKGRVVSSPLTISVRRGRLQISIRFLYSSALTGVSGQIGDALRKLNKELPENNRFP